MSSKNSYNKLTRISEEFQLLAEEKWIIEALTKIKNQRNCLQIERLHLESLKAKLRSNTNKNVPEVSKPGENSVASTSAVNLMQNVTGKNVVEPKVSGEIRLNDATCNEEELNLVVTNPVFNRNINDDFNMEEDDEEESDDDNMFIDINMLMNGILK